MTYIYIYIVSNACIRYFALLRNGIINNYVLSGNKIHLFFVLLCNVWFVGQALQIGDHFSISCCLGMENLGLHEVELTN